MTLSAADLGGELRHGLAVRALDEQRLNGQLSRQPGLDLGVDVDVVEQDQLAAAAIGVQDAILGTARPTAAIRNAVNDKSSPAARRRCSTSRATVTSTSIRPWMMFLRRVACNTSEYARILRNGRVV